jgi:hypothetical protein
MDQSRQTKMALLLVGSFIAVLSAALLVPPLAQPLSYHDFADARDLFGVSNFFNVASNLAILLPGLAGIAFMFKGDVRRPGHTFIEKAEWWPYLLFFAGVTFTSFGSAYYHWNPNNNTLIWDRLPMTLMFMSLFSAILTERVTTAAAKYLTLPLLFFGFASVVSWALSEHAGHGDLRFYAIVQFYPLLCIPAILLLFASRYTNQKALLMALGWYGLAKVAEMFDPQIYSLLHISGHTIKHLLCGVNAYWFVIMLRNRQPLAAPTER